LIRKTAIVVTTVFEPEFLEGYLRSIQQANRIDETTVYIIPDRKTPPTVAAAALAASDAGFAVLCPSLEEQDSFLKRIVVPSNFIPYNSDNRRNIGFLMALEAGCEILISIDDDNFCLGGDDFVGAHHVVGREAADPAIKSSDPWFNICSLLEGWDGPAIFPRGFPYAVQKSTRQMSVAVGQQHLHIAMNAGLWLDEPDVDAVFRLCRQPKIGRFAGNSIVLGPDVWSPINTQNTALTRDAALTYYYVRMGFPLKGLSIDRFGDILSGYLTQKVIKHLGQGIRIGTPIVEHRRTPHNLFKDLYHELAGIVLIEEFLPWLIELKLTGSNFQDAYATLADAIAVESDRFQGFMWDEGGRDFLREMSRLMQIWIRAVRSF
jgi:hypothetical protein